MKNQPETFNFDHLEDRDVEILNALLPWKCFTIDSRGRKLGREAWKGKRSESQPIPDPRIVALNDIINLKDKSVLELGCFEGVHTIGLLSYTSSVLAIDARIENVTKTLARCAAYSTFPKVFVLNIDNAQQTGLIPMVDVLHHVGVLYHLHDPVQHLNSILKKIGNAVLLDTHYATDESAKHMHDSGYKYQEYVELGYDDVFSGVESTSKWLKKDHIISILKYNGFKEIIYLSDIIERNGPRLSIIAKR